MLNEKIKQLGICALLQIEPVVNKKFSFQSLLDGELRWPNTMQDSNLLDNASFLEQLIIRNETDPSVNMLEYFEKNSEQVKNLTEKTFLDNDLQVKPDIFGESFTFFNDQLLSSRKQSLYYNSLMHEFSHLIEQRRSQSNKKNIDNSLELGIDDNIVNNTVDNTLDSELNHYVNEIDNQDKQATQKIENNFIDIDKDSTNITKKFKLL